MLVLDFVSRCSIANRYLLIFFVLLLHNRNSQKQSKFLSQDFVFDVKQFVMRLNDADTLLAQVYKTCFHISSTYLKAYQFETIF